MLVALIAVLVVLGCLAAFLMFRKSGGATPPPQASLPVPAPRPPPAAPATPPAPMPWVPDPAPTDARLHLAEHLDTARKLALLEALRSIPRPPRTLYQIVSPAFLSRASSSELAQLVMTEPVVTARVIAAVNVPLYGLRQPVTNIGQAITFLGLNTVRNLCLQHLLSEAMATKDAGLRAEFDILWKASAVATELCQQIAKRLQLADAASMATQLVLSYVGRFATAVMLQRQGAAVEGEASWDMLQRALVEQQHLGLSSGEIGYLLMQEWGLPEAMVGDTRGITRLLFSGAPAPDPARATRQAVCALSVGLAERIARRAVTELAAYDPATDAGEDMQALRRHLAPAQLAEAVEALRAPEMARVLA